MYSYLYVLNHKNAPYSTMLEWNEKDKIDMIYERQLQ